MMSGNDQKNHEKRLRTVRRPFLLFVATFAVSLLALGPVGDNAHPVLRADSSNGPLTPEDVSGVSLKDINGLNELSSDYAVSPDGSEVPKSEGDDWFPDLSLNSATESEIFLRSTEETPASSANGTTPNRGKTVYAPNPTTAENGGESRLSSVSAPTTERYSLRNGTPLAPARNEVEDPVYLADRHLPGTEVATGSDSSKAISNLTTTNPYLSSSLDQEGTVTGLTGNATLPIPPLPEGDGFLSDFATTDSDGETFPVETPITSDSASQQGALSKPRNQTAQPVASDALSDLSAPAPVSLDPSEGGRPNNSTMTGSPEDSLPSTGLPSAIPTTPEEAAVDPENLIIADIKCSAGMEMPISRFNNLIKTKIGNRFSQQILEEDKRRLLQTKQYVDITVSTSLIPDEPDKVIVNFDFTPRRQMKYIKVIGNRKMSKSEILEELNMKRGESRMDPYDVENGRIRIVELYKSKDLSEPHVEILKGDRPEDVGVVYLINEGVKERVRSTTFVGNTVTSSSHLRHLVSAKPGFLYFIGGEFTRERMDEDVTKLLEYYRNLGYFDARVDREFEAGERFKFWNQENEWIDVKYIINEGPRYKIRDFLFQGNRVIPTEDLRAKLKVKTGSYFNHNDLEADRIALKYAYGEKGYILADITPRQIYTEDDAMIDIRYDIKEDYRYRVKDIKIKYEGEESRTKASVIMNMLDFAPGQVLNDQKIHASENTLKRSGYFNDKPSEGPLPTVSVIPEDQNLYLSHRPDENAPLDKTGEKEANGDAEKTTKENEGNDSGKKDGKKILGQEPDGNGSAGFPKSIRDHFSRRPDDRKEGTNPTDRTEEVKATGFDPGFQVTGSGETAANFVNATEDSTPSPVGQIERTSVGSEAFRFSSDRSLIRGQSVEVPTSFGRRTTTPTSPSSPSPWNGSEYISYQGGTSGTSSSGGNNTYGDTSMYNNGPYATGGTTDPLTGTSTAPPLTASNNNGGLYSSISGTGTVDRGAPGFAAAGRDAVFPGTREQQYLSGQLGEEPIRDATVVASVMEGRTGMFQASIGVNSNYGLVGNVSFTERNFDILKWPTAFWRCDGWTDAFRGGGQIFRAEASPGKYYSRYSVSWDVPYIFDTNYNFGVTGLYADRYYDYWDDSRYGGELRFGRQWTPRFSTTLNGGIYNIKIHNPSVNYIPDINDVLGNNSQYLVGLNACYDTRNHPYMPSEGYVIDGSVEQILGSYSYPRVSLDGRTYFTVHRRVDGTGRMVLGLRSAAGWTGDKTPIYDRYFGGGYQNLRGFEYREVTPRYQQTGIGVGGFFEFYNSAELLIPVSGGDEFQLALFVDTGTVSESISKWGRYRVAPGIGMRISIPMLGPAPLALDFAFPISKDDEDQKEIFSFSITGSR